MAVELIAKIKQINGGTFKLVDAVDVEMSNGQDLETYLRSINIDPSSEEVYVGPTEPPSSKYKIWIDTSKDSIDKSFSSLVIEEFRTIMTSMNARINSLEKEVAYLKAIVESGNIPDIPVDPDEPVTNDLLMVNEDGFVLVNENNQVLCFNDIESTVTTAQIMINEDGSILTNENGQILCFNVTSSTVNNTQIMINEDGNILINENGDILCFQVFDESTNSTTQILINENNQSLVNESGQILCLDVYEMLLTNENDQLLIDENNKILKL